MLQDWRKKQQGQQAAYVSNKHMFDDVNPDTTDYLLGAPYTYYTPAPILRGHGALMVWYGIVEFNVPLDTV